VEVEEGGGRWGGRRGATEGQVEEEVEGRGGGERWQEGERVGGVRW
jgi:hypothetical protein